MNRAGAGLAPAPRRSVVTIGVFDGLHRGHRGILNLVIREARRLKAIPAVVTFDRHPLETLRPPRAPRMIMSLPQRLAALRTAGVTRIEVLKFDRRCAAISAGGFLEKILRRRMHPAAVVVGPDFRFGKGGKGTLAMLREWCRERGVRLIVAPVTRAGTRSVSSSLIRRTLERGDIDTANRLLVRPMEIAGRVIHGAHRGRGWGIPTANLSPETRYALPPGVYAGSAVTNGRWTRAVINIGRRPTISRMARRGRPSWPASHSGRPAVVVEVHLLGLGGGASSPAHLYDRRLRVRLLKRLRAERKFPSSEALVRQIRRDIARVRCLPHPRKVIELRTDD